MFVCPFEGNLLDASTDHCHVEGVGGVADVECDSGIPQNVLVFLAPFNSIDEDEIPIPHRGRPCLSDVGEPSGISVAMFAKVLASMSFLTESGSGFMS